MTEQTGREKLAREKIKEELQAAHTHGTEWPDIAIAYADRRVAEAVARCARVAEEAPLQGPVPLAIAMLIGKAIRALSPAREGGIGDE